MEANNSQPSIDRYDAVKTNIASILRNNTQIDTNSSRWLRSLEQSLILMQNIRFPERFKSTLLTKLNQITDSSVQTANFEAFKPEAFKLLLNICMSLFQVSITEFNSLYSESQRLADPSDFFSLLFETIYLKIMKYFNNDLSDPRLIDYLVEVFHKFELNDLSFLLSMVNCELSEERSLDPIEEKVRKVIKNIFGSSENYEFYLRGNRHLSVFYSQDEDVSENSKRIKFTCCSDTSRQWEICQFGISAENSRLDRIVTIGSNYQSDIFIENLKNLSCAIWCTGNSFRLVTLGEKVMFKVPAKQRIFIETGDKVNFGQEVYLNFVNYDSYSLVCNQSESRVSFDEQNEQFYQRKYSKQMINGKEFSFYIMKYKEKCYFLSESDQILFEPRNSEVMPIFLTRLTRDFVVQESECSEILIKTETFKLEVIRNPGS